MVCNNVQMNHTNRSNAVELYLHSAHRAVWGHLSVVTCSATPHPKDPAGWQLGCSVALLPSLGWGQRSVPLPWGQTKHTFGLFLTRLLFDWRDMEFTVFTGWNNHDRSDVMLEERWHINLMSVIVQLESGWSVLAFNEASQSCFGITAWYPSSN